MCVALRDPVICVDLCKHDDTRGEKLLAATKLPRLPRCCEPPLGPSTHPHAHNCPFERATCTDACGAHPPKAGFLHSAQSQSSAGLLCVSGGRHFVPPQWAGSRGVAVSAPADPEERRCPWFSRSCPPGVSRCGLGDGLFASTGGFSSAGCRPWVRSRVRLW